MTEAVQSGPHSSTFADRPEITTVDVSSTLHILERPTVKASFYESIPAKRPNAEPGAKETAAFVDPENVPVDPSANFSGYGVIAAGMAADSDLSIYRRFAMLNARNVLTLQSEVKELERKLQELDAKAEWSLKLKSRDDAVSESWQEAEEKRSELVKEIRERLHEYTQALQDQAWLLSQKTPEARPRSTLRQFVQDSAREMPEIDQDFLSDENYNDLIALFYDEKDPLSVFLGKYFYRFFLKKDDENLRTHGLRFFSDDKIRQTVRIIAIILSSALPIISIVVLYFIPTQLVRLGVVIAFSAVCSAVLALVSNASNIDIIAATAAYAAVMVVFVSGSS